MAKTTRIREKRVTCDATNNPPMTRDKVLNVRVQVQFEDQSAEHFILDLPIDLAKLRSGGLTHVPISYVTR